MTTFESIFAASVIVLHIICSDMPMDLTRMSLVNQQKPENNDVFWIGHTFVKTYLALLMTPFLYFMKLSCQLGYIQEVLAAAGHLTYPSDALFYRRRIGIFEQ